MNIVEFQGKKIKKLKKINANLLEACKIGYRALSLDSETEESFALEIKQLQKAIAKAEGAKK